MLRQNIFNHYWINADVDDTDWQKLFCIPNCIDGRKVLRELQHDPADGGVFVFVGCTRPSIKLLFWEHSGFVICCKKMDKGSCLLEQPIRP